jgi:hypothetical protein
MKSSTAVQVFLASIFGYFLIHATVSLGAADSKPGGEAEWKRTVDSAKKEGTVVVAGSPDPVMRNEIIPKFTARFGIPVQYTAGGASQIVARLGTERNAKLYSTDIFMAGINTVANILYPNKMLDPLKPALILPEVVDSSKWKKGRLWFPDPEERYVLRPFNSIASLFHVNLDHVKPAELRSSKDLLNPKWRGKISAEDPILGGGGANKAARLYVQLGEEFVSKFYKEQKWCCRERADGGLARAGYLSNLPRLSRRRPQGVAAGGFQFLRSFRVNGHAGHAHERAVAAHAAKPSASSQRGAGLRQLDRFQRGAGDLFTRERICDTTYGRGCVIFKIRDRSAPRGEVFRRRRLAMGGERQSRGQKACGKYSQGALKR